MTIPAFAASASAQGEEPKSVQIGVVERGSFPRSSGSRAATREFTIQLNAGDSVSVDVESDDTDPALEVFQIDRTLRKPIASNDDFGLGLNARVQFTAPAQGIYLIRANVSANPLLSDGEALIAHYRLLVARDALPPRPVPQPLQLGVPTKVRFAGDEARLDGPGLVRVYKFNGVKGQRFAASLDAAKMTDAARALRLELYLGTDDETRVPVDGAIGLSGSAELLAALPESGEYSLVIAQLGGEADYSLLANLVAVQPMQSRRATVGGTHHGSFREGTIQSSGVYGEPEGLFSDEWILPVRRGQHLRIEMCGAAGLDPILSAVMTTPIGERALATSDDVETDPPCGNSIDARLDLTITQNATLRLIASSIEKKPGDYTLSIRQLPTADAASAPSPSLLPPES